MFHTMPFGIGVCVSIFDSSYTSAFAPPRPHGHLRPAPHAGEAEVVAHDGNADATDHLDRALELFHLLRLLRTVEQDVVPVRGIEVLDRFPHESVAFDLPLDATKVVFGPGVLLVLRDAPAQVRRAAREHGVCALEVVDEMDDEMRHARLLGELEVVLGEEAAIQAKPELHGSIYGCRVIEASSLSCACSGDHAENADAEFSRRLADCAYET